MTKGRGKTTSALRNNSPLYNAAIFTQSVKYANMYVLHLSFKKATSCHRYLVTRLVIPTETRLRMLAAFLSFKKGLLKTDNHHEKKNWNTQF